MLSDGLKNNIYIIKVHNVTERGLRGKYEATRASILLLFGMKVRGLCKRTVCTKIEVACEDLCVFACVSVEREVDGTCRVCMEGAWQTCCLEGISRDPYLRVSGDAF